MTKVRKNGITMGANDKIQLAAFLNNGWQKIEDAEKPVNLQTGGNLEYKKSDIARMNVDDLKKLALELKIEGAAESTGDVLKAAIIEKLGL